MGKHHEKRMTIYITIGHRDGWVGDRKDGGSLQAGRGEPKESG